MKAPKEYAVFGIKEDGPERRLTDPEPNRRVSNEVAKTYREDPEFEAFRGDFAEFKVLEVENPFFS